VPDRDHPSASAADLKFLRRLRQLIQEFQIEKRHLNHRVASALWFSKFVPRGAAMYDELRKPGTSVMERLKRRADFRAASSGSRFSTGAFVLQARARGDEHGARIGFTVSKQVGNAVERNRVRRRLREIVRLSAGAAMRDGHDYVLIGRRTALALPFAQMQQQLDTALHRIHFSQQGRKETGKGAGDSRKRSLHQAGKDSAADEH
jgi:ribonuclease P protein component